MFEVTIKLNVDTGVYTSLEERTAENVQRLVEGFFKPLAGEEVEIISEKEGFTGVLSIGTAKVLSVTSGW